MNRNLLAFAMFALAGCAKPPGEVRVAVRGSVSFQGRAMAGGLVSFTPDHERGCPGKIASAFIESDGTFRLADAMAPGWYHIAFAEPPEWYGSDWERSFPAVLRRPDQSGVTRQVKPGVENVFDFPIELRE
jgi:hypothetical protein